jgi:hydroxyacylglutathione hydrolase
VYLQQFFVEGLGHGSYLVGDPEAGVGAVIDPRRDVDGYLAAAQAAGLALRHVLETHTHNDYVSGAKELAAVTGADLWASGAGGGAGLRFPHRALREGDEVPVGRLRLRALETPGHTPGAPGLPRPRRRGAGGRLHRRLLDGRGRRAPRPLRRRTHG